MHLQRVRVPDFRVLQDVEIEFEKEFSPKVFPLGSQNGGGKSTLLQLIFVLLHCSQDPERIVFLENFLEGFQIPEGSSKRDLASFEIWDGEKTVLLEFFCCNDSYLAELVESSNGEDDLLDTGDETEIKFYISDDLEEINDDLLIIKENIDFLKRAIYEIERYQVVNNGNKVNSLIWNKLKEIPSKLKLTPTQRIKLVQRINEISKENLEEELQKTLTELEIEFEDQGNQYQKINRLIEKNFSFLKEQYLLHICNYCNKENDIRKEVALICHIDMDIAEESEIFLAGLSEKIFLAAPVTQVFLFLDREVRKLLFRTQDNETDYYGQFQRARQKLPGLFAYDFLAVDLLVESFKAARDRDFSEAIATRGKYGNHYENLLNQLRSILHDKIVNINQELSGVTVKLDRDGEEAELYPEDLSHGELKRLSIYIWLKHRNIQDAIVLMDEIEIAFHPDWQYEIVRDLQEWAPSNQYILATHSYDLCEAVTPAHVKELEPKLLKSGAEEEK